MEITDLDDIRIDPIFSIEDDPDEEGGVATVIKKKVKKPTLYKVLLHNDDYTTMEFVIYVLQFVFGKSENDAMTVMLKVHKEGHGVCGVFTHEIAETKAQKVLELAKEEGHPLLCSIEPE
jgi:ATP-dependent Clp protease adaptor protein ClpS